MKTVRDTNLYKGFGNDYYQNEDIDQALKELEELLLNDFEGMKRILPSQNKISILKNSSEDYCIGYNHALEDTRKAIKLIIRGK